MVSTRLSTRTSMLAAAVIALLLFGSASASVPAQSQVVTLAAGDSVSIACEGQFVLKPLEETLSVACAEPDAPAPTVVPITTTAGPTVTPAPTTPAGPTATPGPSPTQPPSVAGSGILISRADVLALPMSGAGWAAVKAAAEGGWGSPNLSDLNAKHDVYTLAGALVAVRLNSTPLRVKTAAAILSAIGTESSSRALEISRNIQSYVFAADLIDLRTVDPAGDARFRAWLVAVRSKPFDGMSIIESSEKRPNNWGTHAISARIAIDRYLGDTADLTRAWAVFRGWLGDRSAYAGYSYGDMSWQANKAAPVGINPKGAGIDGRNVDGVLPDDQRRAGGFTWPPPCENYVHEALQGALVASVQLSRAGFNSWAAQDKALLRAYTWLHATDNCPASGDDAGYPHIVNRAYGSSFPAARPAPIGKNAGWLDWIFGS